MELERAAANRPAAELSSDGVAPVVLHVVTGLGIGGAERVLVDLAGACRDAGLSGAVAALVADGPNREKLEAGGTPVIDIGMARGRPGVRGLLRLARVLREMRPDVVQGWMYHADLASLFALWLSGRRSKTRLLWSIRCSDMDPRQYRTMFWMVLWLWARLARCANAVIANSDAGVDVHHALGMQARVVLRIDNGVDTDLFRPDAEARARVRSDLGLADDMIVITTVGRVDPMKDHELFLRAVARLEGVTAMAVGLGTEKLPAAANVLRLGQRDDIPDILAASDILVSTSRFGEGFSNVVVEAMSCSLPVVATDVGDARRIVGDAGLVILPGDEDGLVEALGGLTADTERRRRLGEAARNRAVANFGMDRMVDAFWGLYVSPDQGGR